MATMTTKLGKIDPSSKDMKSSATDSFATKDTYTILIGGDYEEIAPTRASDSSRQEFVIRPSLEYYLDLLNT